MQCNILIIQTKLKKEVALMQPKEAERWLKLLTIIAGLNFVGGVIFAGVNTYVAICMLLCAIYIQLFGFVIWFFSCFTALYNKIVKP
jgi:hypothetical protein